ncbi:hypothetical protein CFOL_v3_24801 [Cephalotus follicularis]|uniref:C2HC zinc finger plants domain-containing protein n=1 Tax=Cephalotus follicularis TaxID=3775 RepID=A0A1Q3CM67_CEPFO|nr:hypothetical protein CFOL_v3_24801 [Cephalotus follicularis]
MESSDSEMVESETSVNVAGVTQQEDQSDVVRDILTLARHHINQGNPTQALLAVVTAMRSIGGDVAVFQSLHRARELYQKRMRENTAADQLATLFAECAIAEAQPLRAEPFPHDRVGTSISPEDHGTSILAETGRMQIVLDAFSDGSSFICLQCGGLVSNHRKDEHYAYWCCKS